MNPPYATILILENPVTLDLRMNPVRPRVAGPEGESASREFTQFPVWIFVDAHARTIYAQLSPLPSRLPLYGPEDFAAAAADDLEDHMHRIQDLLGESPAEILQALCDEAELPPLPPRVPREIANWRARAVLEMAGLLTAVDAAINSMTGPEGVVVKNAWLAGAPLARRGATVTALAPALGLTSQQVDAMFIQAEALNV